MEKLLYGCAYYDEYMPTRRLDEDFKLMKEAGINVIRIAESTWATEEPSEGVFDFSHVTETIEAAAKYDLSVIVGTPTYAIPSWLYFLDSSILAETDKGPGKYGTRQNMDILNPTYRKYAERIIRKLISTVKDYPNVIGYQLDNETKYYDAYGKYFFEGFKNYLKNKFENVEEMNREFGFAYWSNVIDSWEHLPDPSGTINGSYRCEYDKYRRLTVDDFLMWQRGILDEYRREDQFVTHNLDFGWRGYSFGVQPCVNHNLAAKALTVAGCDIYHPSQEHLSGKEIAFCGALAYAAKKQNYLILETEAQGQLDWVPYDGQLRLQAFSHLASGADSVMYWHWHSIHNACETYWKGLLSHDLQPNRLYREAQTIGKDFERLSPHLLHLRKKAKAALLVSNEALSALQCFSLATGWPAEAPGGNQAEAFPEYNDVIRRFYDAMFELNLECDILFPEDENFSDYNLVIAPVLYSAPESLLRRLTDYAALGGVLVTTFKSGFTNEFVTVYHDAQPHLLQECLGITYQEFTRPDHVSVIGDSFPLSDRDRRAEVFMELAIPDGAEVLSHYDHPYWSRYAAVTRNNYQKGTAYYIAALLSKNYIKEILTLAAGDAGIWSELQEKRLPVTVKTGVNLQGKRICYYLNYSGQTVQTSYLFEDGTELLSGFPIRKGDPVELKPWDFLIFEEEKEYNYKISIPKPIRMPF